MFLQFFIHTTRHFLQAKEKKNKQTKRQIITYVEVPVLAPDSVNSDIFPFPVALRSHTKVILDILQSHMYSKTQRLVIVFISLQTTNDNNLYADLLK